MRHARFLMYDDDVYYMPSLHTRSVTGYRPAKFPTHNITTSIVLLYGDCDGLVDINKMLRELPRGRVEVRRLHGYEHLDVLWGKDIHHDVIPEVIYSLKKHCEAPEKIGWDIKDIKASLSAGVDSGIFDNQMSGYATSNDDS